jgi:hypothetical protein
MVGAATRWKAELGHLIDSRPAANSIVSWGAMGVYCFASSQWHQQRAIYRVL